jgi:hypothetical protein
MSTHQKKQHSAKYHENVEDAKAQIKSAEEGMKKMDQEVKEFHTHMSNSMSKLMKTFTDGFAALDKAKQDDPVKLMTVQKD